MRLKDKVAVITGGGSGMGRAACVLFSQEGAKVVVVDINEQTGQETVKLIKDAGNEAVFVKTDLSNFADIKAMAEFAAKTYGKIDILWNNAGMPGPSGVENVTEEQWDLAMSINTKSGFFATQAVLPYMKKQGKGSVIFTSSTAGLVGSPSSPVYSAAKGAVSSMVRAMGNCLGAMGIRVNAICPALTNTPMAEKFLVRPGEEDKFEKNKETFLGGIALGRMGEPIDMAYAGLFLASDESDFVTGTNLSVDGGFVAK